ILTPIIKEFNGTLHKEIGDGLLFTFPTVTDAVKCGIKIQEETKANDDLNLRIGIHEGEITLKDGDALGDDVNVASRIEAFSPSGGIAISSKVQQNISSLPEFETSYVGKPELKGVAQKVEVYCITSHGLPETDVSKVSAKLEKEKKWSFTKKILLSLTGIFLMVTGAIFWFIYPLIAISMGIDKTYDASIAILYMENMSPEEKSYFADGLTEELINRLSRIDNLKVIPRTDVAVFKKKSLSLNEIANTLNVNYIVEGSVRIDNEKLRVNANLIDIIQGKAVWSNTYSNKLEDFFGIQDEIANNIVNKLSEKLSITKTDLEATKRKSTENLEAYNLIMQAYKHINNPIYTEVKLAEIITPLAFKAIKLDSTYADAYAIASFAKINNWLSVSPTDSAMLEQESTDLNEANWLIKTALQYDEDNLLALGLKTILPMVSDPPDSKASLLFIVRSMFVDAKIFLQRYPNQIISKYVYAMTQYQIKDLQNDTETNDKESLDLLLEIFNKLKANDFVLKHPTEGMILPKLFFDIAFTYYDIEGDMDKSADFINENKQYFCGDNTYDCLNAELINRILYINYEAYEYEEALELINMIILQSEEELANVG
ncbi:uncharacterized protein METZ01_LOCUS190254, partial [marine metagenome]